MKKFWLYMCNFGHGFFFRYMQFYKKKINTVQLDYKVFGIMLLYLLNACTVASWPPFSRYQVFFCWDSCRKHENEKNVELNTVSV